MKAYEIAGGYAHICDCCEIDDGRPTLSWSERDFDLCFSCISGLFFEYIAKLDKEQESIIIKRQQISEKLRNKIFDRDNNQCIECKSTKELQIDHIIPFSLGGKTTEDNLQTLCKTCNCSKGNK